MENTLKSLSRGGETGAQLLGPGAVALSTAGDRQSLEEALKVAVVLVGCLSAEMLSPESLELAFIRAARLCGGKEEVLRRVWADADRIRQSNPLSGMF